MPAFLDEVIDDFYERLGAGYETTFLPGQFFVTHAYYPHKQLEVWRPLETDDTGAIARSFHIASAPQDVFNKKAGLARPSLRAGEEFVVIRAKKRPVVLIQPPDPQLRAIDTRGYTGRVVRDLAPVALCFGAVHERTQESRFLPEFIDRVRRLEYPQFLFLPAAGGPLYVDSILRLDEIQSVFATNLEPLPFRFTEDVLDIFLGQLAFFLGGQLPNAFTLWREELAK